MSEDRRNYRIQRRKKTEIKKYKYESSYYKDFFPNMDEELTLRGMAIMFKNKVGNDYKTKQDYYN